MRPGASWRSLSKSFSFFSFLGTRDLYAQFALLAHTTTGLLDHSLSVPLATCCTMVRHSFSTLFFVWARFAGCVGKLLKMCGVIRLEESCSKALLQFIHVEKEWKVRRNKCYLVVVSPDEFAILLGEVWQLHDHFWSVNLDRKCLCFCHATKSHHPILVGWRLQVSCCTEIIWIRFHFLPGDQVPNKWKHK